MVKDPELRTYIEETASKAATKAVNETLKHFGVDMGNFESVKSFRADLIHAHKARRRDEGRAAFWLRLVGAVTIGVLVAIATGIASWVGSVLRDLNRLLNNGG